MARVLTIPNCTVEITLPEVGVQGVHLEVPTVKMYVNKPVDNTVVRFGDKIVTIHNAKL